MELPLTNSVQKLGSLIPLYHWKWLARNLWLGISQNDLDKVTFEKIKHLKYNFSLTTVKTSTVHTEKFDGTGLQ